MEESNTLRQRVTQNDVKCDNTNKNTDTTTTNTSNAPPKNTDTSAGTSSTGGGEEEKNNDSSFECNICLDIASDAVISLCGHLFW